MKTKISICAIVLFLGISVQAKIWRVNNNPSINADYSNLQAAINNASNGDTIYVEGSASLYEGNETSTISVNRKVVIIGPGYNLAENDSTLFNKSHAEIQSLVFSPGSDSSVVQGCKITHVTVDASNVFVQRNFIDYVYLANSSAISNPVVKQNLISGTIRDIEKVSNGVITNNILLSDLACINGNNLYSNYYIAHNNINGYHTITSVGSYAISVRHSTIENNICRYPILAGYYTIDNVWFSQYNTINNNLSSLDNLYDAQFVGGSIIDKQYMLQSGSVAIGAATDGSDCGAFGGSAPYVLSGLPPIPHIYEIIAPTSGSANTGLPVKIKIKSQN